jgi:hypothetical protein
MRKPFILDVKSCDAQPFVCCGCAATHVYGDVVTDEMSVASGKVTRLALNGR